MKLRLRKNMKTAVKLFGRMKLGFLSRVAMDPINHLYELLNEFEDFILIAESTFSHNDFEWKIRELNGTRK